MAVAGIPGRQAGRWTDSLAACPLAWNDNHRGVIIGLEGAKGVPRNGGRKQQLVRSCFALNDVHVQTLTLTDFQTPFPVTPLVPLTCTIPVPFRELGQSRAQEIYTCIYVYVCC